MRKIAGGLIRLTVPNKIHGWMILKVAPDRWGIELDINACSLQDGLGTNAAPL